jgi:CBS domain-containing protein
VAPFILRACRRFAVGTGASAAVEYAAVLMLVVGLSYLAYVALAVPSNTALTQVAENMRPGSNTSSPGRGRAANGNAARAPEAALAEEERSTSTESGDSSGLWLRGAALGMTVLAAALLIFDRRRRLARLAKAAEERSPDKAQAHFAEKRQQILRMLTGHTRHRPGACVTVGHLMTTKLTTVPSSTPAEELHHFMQEGRLRHLLVVRGQNELIGVVSDRDMAHRPGPTAAEIMTRNPIAVSSDAPAIPCITTMLRRRFSCLPVVDDGRLVGLLTTTDLMMALQCTLQLLSQSADASLADAPTEVKGARYFARLLEGEATEPCAGETSASF